jgi:hypothetical protein
MRAFEPRGLIWELRRSINTALVDQLREKKPIHIRKNEVAVFSDGVLSR